MRSLLCVIALVGGICAQSIIPPGFVVDDIVPAGNLVAASCIDVTRDGRIFVGELSSGRILTHRAGVTSVVGVLPDVIAGIESGLLGIAVDPKWPQAPYLYAYYTTGQIGGARENVLRRFRIEGEAGRVDARPLQLGEGLTLLSGLDALADQHNGGGLRFGAGDVLYLGIGDNSDPCRAQDLAEPYGKLLRLKVTHLHGRHPDAVTTADLDPGDNPFSGPAPITRLISALGLRNPFRIATDLTTGAVIIGDVGENDFEEIDLSFGGENFGWPWFEGRQVFTGHGLGAAPSGLSGPAIVLNHAPPENFDVVMPFGGYYRSDPNARFDFGPTFDQQLIFTDFGGIGPLIRSVYDPASQNWLLATPVPGQFTPSVWGTIPFVVDAVRAHDGAIYYTTLINSQIARLRPAAAGTTLVEANTGLGAGNADAQAFAPFRVQLQDANGLPLPNERVVFSIADGDGSLSDHVVLTDAGGFAETQYRFALERPDRDPRLVAWHPAATPISRSAVWRGLSSEWRRDDRGRVQGLQIDLRTATPMSPYIVAAQLSPIGSPYTSTAAGPVWTTILAPNATLRVLGDGPGFVGAPSTNFVTDANGEASRVLRNAPIITGTVFTLQAYAVDAALPYPASLFVSNPLHLTTP